ncbi:MAG: hypothetical protein ACOCYO_00420 [Bacteroidota bacterium]
MLEIQKKVIENLSNDKELFVKEIKKSIKWLSKPETEQLRSWLYSRFWKTHQKEISVAFKHSVTIETRKEEKHLK